MKRLFAHWRVMLLFAFGLGLTGAAALPFASWLTVPSRLERVRKDYKEINKACDSLAIDHCGLAFPEDNYLSRDNYLQPLTFGCRPIKNEKGLPDPYHCCLTTPIPYLFGIPLDPFKDHYRGYEYAAIRDGSKGYPFMGILSSPGPDGKNDLPLVTLRERIYAYRDARHTVWKLSSADRGLIRQWIDPYLYDPTNGIRSGGDLIQVMERNRRRYGYGVVHPSPEWMNTAPPEMMPIMEKGKAVRAANMGADEEKKDWDDWKVTPPEELARALYAAGVLMGDGQKIIGDVLVEAVDRLRNHLGAFGDFFDHPRAGLDEAQKKALNDWRLNNPQWWLAMRDPESVPGRRIIDRLPIKYPSLGAYDFYPVLIIYGKSQLLQAADEVGQGNDSTAMRRITELRDNLNNLENSRELIARDPNIERIHQELGRMCDELKTDIIKIQKHKETAI